MMKKNRLQKLLNLIGQNKKDSIKIKTVLKI